MNLIPAGSCITASTNFWGSNEALTNDHVVYGEPHGLLSYALISEGLEEGRAAFRPKDGRILISEWLAYAAEEVPRLFNEGESKGVIQRREAGQGRGWAYQGRTRHPCGISNLYFSTSPRSVPPGDCLIRTDSSCRNASELRRRTTVTGS